MITLSGVVAKFALRFCTDRLKDELNLKITGGIISHADQLELSKFEDPRIQDIIARANQNTALNFSNFLGSSLAAMTNGIQAVSLGLFLVSVDPLIVVLMLPVAVPYFISQRHLSRALNGLTLLKRARAYRFVMGRNIDRNYRTFLDLAEKGPW